MIAASFIAAGAGGAAPASAQDVPGLVDVVPLPSLADLGALAPIDEGSRHLVYVNGRGGTYSPGLVGEDSSENRTSLADEAGTLVIPPFELRPGEDTFERVARCLRIQYARYDVAFTTEDPGSEPHLEVVLGGDGQELGFAEGVVGIAPLRADCSVVERGTALVFPESFEPLGFASSDTETLVDRVCSTAAHELGHLLGLDHSFSFGDVMSYHSEPAEVLSRESAPCGEYAARSCQCGDAQSSAAHVGAVLGLRAPEDSEPPTIDDVEVSVDDDARALVQITTSDDVRRVDLFVDGVVRETLGAPPFRATLSGPEGSTLEVRAVDGAFNEATHVERLGDEGGLGGSGCACSAAGAPAGLGAPARTGVALAVAALARRVARRRRRAT